MTENVIDVRDLWHWYLRGTPLESVALQGASFTLAGGEIVGIMGHTGSGKSTLAQHFNGLLRPHRGTVRVFGTNLGDRHADLCFYPLLGWGEGAVFVLELLDQGGGEVRLDTNGFRLELL